MKVPVPGEIVRGLAAADAGPAVLRAKAADESFSGARKSAVPRKTCKMKGAGYVDGQIVAEADMMAMVVDR